MKDFSDAYAKARSVVSNYKFSPDWHKYLTDDVAAKLIFASAAGPERTQGKRLDKLREKIASISKSSEAEVLMKMAGVNPSGSQTLTTGQAEALATLKLMRHFYLQHEQGAQSIWLYSSPFSLHDWIFNELKGTTVKTAKDKLDKVDEVYPKKLHRKLESMVNETLKWCGNCQAKLGAADKKTQGLVKTWFFHKDPSDAEMKKVSDKLKDGYRDICVLLRANKLIFSDDPIDRMGGGKVKGQKNYGKNWTFYGFVNDPMEKLDVVYIQGGTLEELGGTNEWMAILAILHELTHRIIDTLDASYDYDGIQPNAVFGQKHTIRNADSWAYFAADMNGKLTDAKRKEYYFGPKALQADYLKEIGSP